jgi:hypothetical protein
MLFNYDLDVEVVQPFKYEAYIADDFLAGGIENPSPSISQYILKYEDTSTSWGLMKR